MKDFLGNDIEVGDEVVYITNSGRIHNSLNRGIVVGLSETMITVERLDRSGVASTGRRERKSADKAVVVAQAVKDEE